MPVSTKTWLQAFTGIAGLVCSPSLLTSPAVAVCMVMLADPAGTSGVPVSIGTAATGVTAIYAASITVQPGKTSAAFSIHVPAAAVPGKIIVTASANGSSASTSLTVKPALPPIRVAAGATSSYTDPQGNLWSADYGYSGGSASSTSANITNTTTPTLYQHDRWQQGGFSYTFTVPNGTHTVTLKFADITFTQTANRIFNVLINGQTVLSNFDIVAQAGGAFRAVDRTFSANVTGGTVTIQFSAVVSNPVVSAIAIQ